MRIIIDTKKCTGCAVCREYCPKGRLDVRRNKTYVKDGCDVCGKCIEFCIMRAISLEDESEMAEMQVSQEMKSRSLSSRTKK